MVGPSPATLLSHSLSLDIQVNVTKKRLNLRKNNKERIQSQAVTDCLHTQKGESWILVSFAWCPCVINIWPVKPFETVMVIKGYTNKIELKLNWKLKRVNHFVKTLFSKLIFFLPKRWWEELYDMIWISFREHKLNTSVFNLQFFTIV